MAIMSTKGMSNTASRQLVNDLCHDGKGGVPLFVLHDFDKAGFSIVGTLQRDTRRFAFSNDVNVIDLGLHIEDVEEYELQSEDVAYGKSDPTDNLCENGATDREIEFLCSGRKYGDYGDFVGKRVELNAFSSGDFVKWIECKLKKCGIKKVVPNKETLQDAYRRAVVAGVLNRELVSLMSKATETASDMTLPPGQLAAQVRKLLKRNPTMPWDEAVASIVEDEMEASY